MNEQIALELQDVTNINDYMRSLKTMLSKQQYQHWLQQLCHDYQIERMKTVDGDRLIWFENGNDVIDELTLVELKTIVHHYCFKK